MSENRYFAFIPQTTVNSTTLNALAPTTRWIYVVLVGERHGLDTPFPMPYEQIRQITGFSKTTISKAIKALSKAGYLSYKHGGLEQNPNYYDLENDYLTL